MSHLATTPRRAQSSPPICNAVATFTTSIFLKQCGMLRALWLRPSRSFRPPECTSRPVRHIKTNSNRCLLVTGRGPLAHKTVSLY